MDRVIRQQVNDGPPWKGSTEASKWHGCIHTHRIKGSVLLGVTTGAVKDESKEINRNPLPSEKRRGGPRQAVSKPAIKSGIDAKAI